ncbi:hypothetical protein H696_03881 [Fonticula alba]|uniref:Essential protein Yae1 N-terminal domain-containing protein n=1 Tax=Fonticula alba TaxID=691883 RepID=A0A058Z7G3_FONAL|nr:hypothetical protein H696_03881 [Fonticula alba]KCV69452.1 hypothetical protein H696_03881 [Fonticula alba]|eukprot:XP_009496017.1 hypothetical protein H696_03881 [Fonticula alba]
MSEPQIPSSDPWDDLDGTLDDISELDIQSALSHQRLRKTFVNAGYRQGLDTGKAETAQAGFDAGFVTGAELGFDAGLSLASVVFAISEGNDPARGSPLTTRGPAAPGTRDDKAILRALIFDLQRVAVGNTVTARPAPGEDPLRARIAATVQSIEDAARRWREEAATTGWQPPSAPHDHDHREDRSCCEGNHGSAGDPSSPFFFYHHRRQIHPQEHEADLLRARLLDRPLLPLAAALAAIEPYLLEANQVPAPGGEGLFAGPDMDRSDTYYEQSEAGDRLPGSSRSEPCGSSLEQEHQEREQLQAALDQARRDPGSLLNRIRRVLCPGDAVLEAPGAPEGGPAAGPAAAVAPTATASTSTGVSSPTTTPGGGRSTLTLEADAGGGSTGGCCGGGGARLAASRVASGPDVGSSNSSSSNSSGCCGGDSQCGGAGGQAAAAAAADSHRPPPSGAPAVGRRTPAPMITPDLNDW